MATLIAVYAGRDASGRPILVGRCDAKCYNAECPDCDCICGGRNHSRGLEKATDQTREYAEEWLQEYSHRKGLKDFSHSLGRDVRSKQLALFDLANFSDFVET